MITLLTSKASQEAAEQDRNPTGPHAGSMPGARNLGHARWAATEAARVLPDRPAWPPQLETPHGPRISAIVQTRMRRLEHRRGKTRKDAKAAAALFSGHSLRTGYAVSAAAKELPSYRIQAHTRHKSADMVQGYIRESDRWGKSGLKGVGF